MMRSGVSALPNASTGSHTVSIRSTRRQYTRSVKFGSWYPLADAGDLAPAGENVLQLRLATGLVDYPRGKSAMVHYEHALDSRAAALDLAQRLAKPHTFVCRHLIELDP